MILLVKNAKDPGFDFVYEGIDRVDTVTFGKTINQKTSNEDSVDNPFPKYQLTYDKILQKRWVWRL